MNEVGIITPVLFSNFEDGTNLQNFPRKAVLLLVYLGGVRYSSSFHWAISTTIMHTSPTEELMWVFWYVLNIAIFTIYSGTRKIITMSFTSTKILFVF